MKRALMTATAAIALAATPAAAQVVGGENEVATDTQVETEFADDGAETRTGVSSDVKVDPDNEMADWDEDAEDPLARSGEGGPYASDRDDASQRYNTLDGEPRMEDERETATNASVQGLSQYELEQLRKAGAATQADTLDQGDLSY